MNAGEYANLPLISAYLDPDHNGLYENGVNFASGGGGVLPESYGKSVGIKLYSVSFYLHIYYSIELNAIYIVDSLSRP